MSTGNQKDTIACARNCAQSDTVIAADRARAGNDSAV